MSNARFARHPSNCRAIAEQFVVKCLDGMATWNILERHEAIQSGQSTEHIIRRLAEYRGAI